MSCGVQSNERIYYVYLHHRSTDGSIFYVGKGSRGRKDSKWSRSRWWSNVVKKHGFYSTLIRDGMSEPCANTLERITIEGLRRSGIDLVNITDGGDGYRHQNIGRMIKVCCSDGLEFESVNSAASHYGVTASKISACINGRRLTCAGNSWWRKGEHPVEFSDPIERVRKSRSRAVYRSDGKVFESAKSAASEMGCTPSAITVCAGGRVESALGYGWSYEGVPDHPEDRYVRAKRTMAATRLRG